MINISGGRGLGPDGLHTGKSSEEEFLRYLVERSFLGKEELAGLSSSARLPQERLAESLVRQGVLTAEKLAEALAAYFGVPYVSLTQVNIDPRAVQKISEQLARRYTVIPILYRPGILRLAISDPGNLRALDAVRLFSGCEVEPVVAGAEEIMAAIRQYMTVNQTVDKLHSLSEPLAEEAGVWSVDDQKEQEAEEDGPTVRLVSSLLQQAVAQNASDIHWEPGEHGFVVRFRLDGQLYPHCQLPLNIARSVVSRLKVMARMDVAERRLPQDGRLSIVIKGRKIDLRVSSLPTVYGEKVVVRILDAQTAERSLSELGMSPEVEAGVRSLLQQPHGLILVVGPTGSGKTTTLYALLRELKAQTLNIVSIEDPVEYRLPGVNQVQVHAKIGLTFANGLRAILRQDPDVIMVGEIRDEETARIAIAASLTGHLVLSTLHTNTAAEALTRLLDMGIEPYLLASTVGGILSQRLVRLLCPYCRTPYQFGEAERKVWGILEQAAMYQAVGCSRCRGSGYHGRIGIHELLLYNRDIKKLVLTRHSSSEIEQAAIASGMHPLLRDGMSKAEHGLTTVGEVVRSATGIER